MHLTAHLRYTFRQVQKHPGFYGLAVAALALGIGANTAIFSAVEAVLLRPLPYREPSRLVMLWEDMSFIGFAHNNPSPANYVDWKAQNQVFTDMAASRFTSASLTGDQSPEELIGKAVTPNFFDVLGVEPAIGRPFTREEDAAKAKVVVLAHRLWKRRFGADPAIVGQSILMDGERTTVVGVMPADFFFPSKDTVYWVPASFSAADLARRGRHYLHVVARLRPGISRERAQQEMDVIARRLAVAYPEDNTHVGAVVLSLRDEYAGDQKSGLVVLQIASIFVLLIACSNLANLLLARAARRRREIAVRIAVGASRGQIAAQLLTESTAVALAGGVAGLLLAMWSYKALERVFQIGSSSAVPEINARVLLFTLGLAVVAGALFGMAPVLRSAKVSLGEELKEGSRAGEAPGGIRLRDGLVVGQFALAFALLVGAGLMILTLWNLGRQELGFETGHLLTMSVPLGGKNYDSNAKLRNFYRATLERVRALPGIRSAAFSSNPPFTSMGNTASYAIEGQPALKPGEVNDALYREVTAGYLETIGATLVSGRFLESGDREGTVPAVVINEFMARRHWPGQDAVGKRLRLGEEASPWITVVGVVRDLRERGLLLGMKPAMYLPDTQVDRPGAEFLVVRTAGPPEGVTKALEGAVWAVDRDQPVAEVRTMEALMEENVADRKRPMMLLGIFAGLALLLSSIGIYSVLAYAVEQRTREIGVRMALGARAGDVTRMILGRGLSLSAMGLLVGALMAFLLGRLLDTLLYGVGRLPVGVYLAMAAVLVAVAALASVIPAWRAAIVDPVVALRDE